MGERKMKTTKLYSIGLVAVMIFTFSQPDFAQIVDFYSSPGYSAMINNLINNHIWNSSMKHYTKNYKRSSGASTSSSSKSSGKAPAYDPCYLSVLCTSGQVPADRRYPAVQFKSTGTRLTQDVFDSPDDSPQDRAEVKELVLKIFKEYEAAAASRGYPNDWALAYVSYVGLNSHVYHGKTEKPIIPFYQNVELRDVIAKYATDHGIFNNVTDRKKQELYEFFIMLGGVTYHQYEKARRENNAEDLKDIKLFAAKNLKLLGITP